MTGSSERPARLRVVTWNIRAAIGPGEPFPPAWWRHVRRDRLERIAAILDGLDPDIATLQEVAILTPDGELLDEPAELARLTGRSVRYAAIHAFPLVEPETGALDRIGELGQRDPHALAARERVRVRAAAGWRRGRDRANRRIAPLGRHRLRRRRARASRAALPGRRPRRGRLHRHGPRDLHRTRPAPDARSTPSPPRLPTVPDPVVVDRRFERPDRRRRGGAAGRGLCPMRSPPSVWRPARSAPRLVRRRRDRPRSRPRFDGRRLPRGDRGRRRVGPLARRRRPAPRLTPRARDWTGLSAPAVDVPGAEGRSGMSRRRPRRGTRRACRASRTRCPRCHSRWPCSGQPRRPGLRPRRVVDGATGRGILRGTTTTADTSRRAGRGP